MTSHVSLFQDLQEDRGQGCPQQPWKLRKRELGTLGYEEDMGLVNVATGSVSFILFSSLSRCLVSVILIASQIVGNNLVENLKES